MIPMVIWISAHSTSRPNLPSLGGSGRRRFPVPRNTELSSLSRHRPRPSVRGLLLNMPRKRVSSVLAATLRELLCPRWPVGDIGPFRGTPSRAADGPASGRHSLWVLGLNRRGCRQHRGKRSGIAAGVGTPVTGSAVRKSDSSHVSGGGFPECSVSFWAPRSSASEAVLRSRTRLRTGDAHQGGGGVQPQPPSRSPSAYRILFLPAQYPI